VAGVAGWWVGFGSVDGQDADQDRDASRDLVQLYCFVIAVRLAEVAAAEDDRVETTEARIQVADLDRSVLAAWCGDDWWFAWPWPERISPVFPGLAVLQRQRRPVVTAVTVTVVCDLPDDGEVEGREAVSFSFDGTAYEIDVCTAHARELHARVHQPRAQGQRHRTAAQGTYRPGP